MAGVKVINPYDQSLVCELPYDQGAVLERKLEAAARAYEFWHRLPIDQRIKQVEAGLAKFRKNAEDIARQITLQMGKPILQARREVETFFERAEYMVSIAKESLAPEILPRKKGFVRRIEHAPLGVILNMGAWNYPLLIPVNVIVPALLAGNVILLKHSAQTPLCGQAFEKAFGELETPDVVTSLILTHAQTEKLVQVTWNGLQGVMLARDLWANGEPNWPAALEDPLVKLHLYGKAEPRVGRKMGHITAVGTTTTEAVARVKSARERLLRPNTT